MLRQEMRRPELLLCAAALLLLAFLGLSRGLWTPDEPREAEIGREMALNPSIIPTLNGQPFIEKPPLYYWTVAFAYKLAGQPSAAAARLVSVLAGLGTLLLVFLWAARAHSLDAGMLASLMLATSLQFTISTHWVLLDPLLMLFTTGAAWAAWELLCGGKGADRGGWLRAALYATLALALWTKGLIGPVLIVAGLIAFIFLAQPVPWRTLWPFTGALLLAATLALLAAAIWSQGGKAALWEWGWVNHVQRLTHPGRTGHRQPLLYYLWTLPYALLPWLVPFVASLWAWRRPLPPQDAARALIRYCQAMSAAMLLVLSVSATKRETYLLPMLPLIFVGLGVHVAEWWRGWRERGRAPLGLAWWLQMALLLVCLLAPPLAVCVWLRRADSLAVADLAVAGSCAAALWWACRSGRRAPAALLALVAAVLAMGSLQVLAAHALNGMKDMVPFVSGVGRELTPGAPVYTTGVDETLQGIVPFATGRQLLVVDPAVTQPQWLLIQNNHQRASGQRASGQRGPDDRAPGLPPDYTLERSQSFGPGRELQLWRRREP